MFKGILGGLIVTSLAAVAMGGTFTVDGTRVGDTYGAARAVQTVETGFGDNLSEWNAAYGAIDGGRLYLMLTGNLEGNFNKLEVLIDSAPGGFNTYPAAPGNDGSGVLAGMTFDAGFDPDYHVIARRGFDGSNNRFDLDMGVLGTPTFSSYFFVFGLNQEGIGATGTGPANASPIEVAYNNSNTAGIVGGSGPADPTAAQAVTTGFEMSIALSDLGYTSGPIRAMIWQNNQDHRYLSNQFLGGLPPPQGNLGSDGFGNYDGGSPTIGQNHNFNNYGGNQYFVIPEPAPAALLVLGGLALLRRRG